MGDQALVDVPVTEAIPVRHQFALQQRDAMNVTPLQRTNNWRKVNWLRTTFNCEHKAVMWKISLGCRHPTERAAEETL